MKHLYQVKMRKFVCAIISWTCLVTGSALADVTEIDNEQLEILQADGVAIIDVRRLEEWKSTGLIDGSYPMTFFDANGRFDLEAWLDELEDVAKPDQPLALICASGVRSAEIAAFLDRKLGFSNVYNVSKGINAWIREKRPVIPYTP